MSQFQTDSSNDVEDIDAWIDEHREQLEREAASDTPAAWVCERLLQSSEGSS